YDPKTRRGNWGEHQRRGEHQRQLMIEDGCDPADGIEMRLPVALMLRAATGASSQGPVVAAEPDKARGGSPTTNLRGG
ncbi:MAG: hypothetical protein OXF98_12720, partial [Rhodospirillaceae bacterium]|nr:hypothetical protein [Rhodospirillaceae bacterium]